MKILAWSEITRVHSKSNQNLFWRYFQWKCSHTSNQTVHRFILLLFFFSKVQVGKNRLTADAFFVGWSLCWRQGDAPYKCLDWPTVAKLAYTLASPAHWREAFCSWRSCCTKKYFLLFSFSLSLVLVLLRLIYLLKDMVKKIIKSGKKKHQLFKRFKRKRIVNLLFYWIFDNSSIFINIPTNTKIFQNSLKSLLLCTDIWVVWLTVGACRTLMLAACRWAACLWLGSFPPASSHLLLKCTSCKGNIRYRKVDYILDWS